MDLGYHLSCGRAFWQSGHIVQEDTFIAPPLDPADADRGDLLPGSTFDPNGQYHFPNANWLSQVILAGLWAAGGWTAMNVTLVVCVAVIGLAQMVMVRRLGIPLGWLAPIWLMTGLVAHERFMVRPELFIYLCLIGQLCLVLGPMTWRAVAAVVVLQVLAVNCHSYWLLGVGIVGAAALVASGRALRAGRSRSESSPTEARRRAVCLMVCLALVVAAGMVHPAGPANLTFPFRMLSYLQQYDLSPETAQEAYGRGSQGQLHPWWIIGELRAPFGPGWSQVRSMWALAGLLAAGACGGALLLWHRRWALAMMLVAFCVVALSVRRNVAIPALLGGPLIAAAIQWTWLRWRAAAGAAGTADEQARRERTMRWAGPVGLLAVGALSVYWFVGVVTSEFYRSEPSDRRFGRGYSRLMLPVGACQWLDANLPRAQAVFTDQTSSSSVVFYSDTVTAAPAATNGWAMTPARMARVLAVSMGHEPITRLDEWGLDVVVLQGWRINMPLARRLLASARWALVRVDVSFLVFVRRIDAHASLIEAGEITRDRFDAVAYAESLRRADALPLSALQTGVGVLRGLRWFEHVETLCRAALDDPVAQASDQWWMALGQNLALQGRRRLAGGDSDGLAQLTEAGQCFSRAFRIAPANTAARKSLLQVQQDLARFSRPRGINQP